MGNLLVTKKELFYENKWGCPLCRADKCTAGGSRSWSACCFDQCPFMFWNKLLQPEPLVTIKQLTEVLTPDT